MDTLSTLILMLISYLLGGISMLLWSLWSVRKELNFLENPKEMTKEEWKNT